VQAGLVVALVGVGTMCPAVAVPTHELIYLTHPTNVDMSRAYGATDLPGSSYVVCGEARVDTTRWAAHIWVGDDVTRPFYVEELPPGPRDWSLANGVIVMALDPDWLVYGSLRDVLLAEDTIPWVWRGLPSASWTGELLPTLAGMTGAPLAGVRHLGTGNTPVLFGWSTTAADVRRAVRWVWDPLGEPSIVPLPPPYGPSLPSQANCAGSVGPDGSVVVGGAAVDSTAMRVPVAWTYEAGVFNVEVLPLPGGATGGEVLAADVNVPLGCPGHCPTDLVGWWTNAAGDTMPAYWSYDPGQDAWSGVDVSVAEATLTRLDGCRTDDPSDPWHPPHHFLGFGTYYDPSEVMPFPVGYLDLSDTTFHHYEFNPPPDPDEGIPVLWSVAPRISRRGRIPGLVMIDNGVRGALTPWAVLLRPRFAASGIGDPSLESGAASALDLEVFPMPAHPTAHISFRASPQGAARITIFDVAGRSVRTLNALGGTGGERSVLWDGRSSTGTMLATGVYVVRVEADGLTESRKIVLAR